MTTTIDDHEAFEADAEAIVSQVFEGAKSKLQHAFPYMSSVEIERMVEKSVGNLKSDIKAQEQAMDASKARTSFFTLPPELRVYIYELSLAGEEVPRPDEHAFWEIDRQVEIQEWECCGDPNTNDFIAMKPTKRPDLLAVNREVRREALPVYYAVNTFTATYNMGDEDSKLVNWLQTIGKEQAAMIKDLRIRFYMMDPDVVGNVMDAINSKQGVETKWGENDGLDICDKDVVKILKAVECGVKDAAVTVGGNWVGFEEDDGTVYSVFSSA